MAHSAIHRTINKKRESTMQLENIIFHDLVKAQYKDQITITRRSELELPDPNADLLVKNASNSYMKDSGLAYATFLDSGWFTDKLRELLASKVTFADFSKSGLDQLRDILKGNTFATGGYLFFVRYTDENVNYLLVLLLKDIAGLIVDGNKISESHILNLDKLHFAARVNINNWLDNEGRYITFLKGRSRAEVSGYFKRFLCIDDSTFDDPKANTKSLVKVVIDYATRHIESEPERRVIQNRVAASLRLTVDEKKPITIQEVAALVNPEDPEEFIKYLRSTNYEIQDEFRVDKGSIKGLVRYEAKTKNYTLTFGHEAIDSKAIALQYDDDKTPYLVISQLPDSIVNQLKPLDDEDSIED